MVYAHSLAVNPAENLLLWSHIGSFWLPPEFLREGWPKKLCSLSFAFSFTAPPENVRRLFKVQCTSESSLCFLLWLRPFGFCVSKHWPWCNMEKTVLDWMNRQQSFVDQVQSRPVHKVLANLSWLYWVTYIQHMLFNMGLQNRCTSWMPLRIYIACCRRITKQRNIQCSTVLQLCALFHISSPLCLFSITCSTVRSEWM